MHSCELSVCKGRRGKRGEEKREKREGEGERSGSDSTKDHSRGIVKTLESVLKERILMWRVN